MSLRWAKMEKVLNIGKVGGEEGQGSLALVPCSSTVRRSSSFSLSLLLLLSSPILSIVLYSSTLEMPSKGEDGSSSGGGAATMTTTKTTLHLLRLHLARVFYFPLSPLQF